MTGRNLRTYCLCMPWQDPEDDGESWCIPFRYITFVSLIMFSHYQTLPFEKCNLKINVSKFQKSSVGLQLTTLLENKFLHNYFSRFSHAFKRTYLKERYWFSVWLLSRELGSAHLTTQ